MCSRLQCEAPSQTPFSTWAQTSPNEPLVGVLERKGPIPDHGLHHQRRCQALRSRKAREALVIQPLENRHIGGEHLQEIVRLAKQPLSLDDLSNGCL